MGNAEFVCSYLRKLQVLTSKDVVEFFKKYYSKDAISHTALLPNKSCR